MHMFMCGMDGEARGEDQDFPGLPAPLFSKIGSLIEPEAHQL